MMKKMLLLALLPACPAFAQTPMHEEDAPPPVISVLNQELKDTRMRLALPGNKEASIQPLQFSPARELEQLRVSGAYHEPEALLQAKATTGNNLQEVSRQRFNGVSLNLEGVIYDQLDCYVVHDQYEVASGNELPGNFSYDNTYLVYKDQAGTTVAEVIYIQCSIGNATTEKKIVRQAKPALATHSFTIAPNPAQKNIRVSFRNTDQGSYTLQISNPEGKVIKTLIDRQILESGAHTFDFTLDLQPGFYIVSLSSGKAIPVSQKLIIK
ncbi:T9SS type A sorting domain-containing protein [Taibaiella chishuiensis]|uniref:Putative secreted protein (Por secretion system target) n=1 Tax=Taibaiella chishuiensis TaxID=1434707 RepID=A0A2P8D1Y5_9BACT|nr:T9SS type A sorting domain-containing protein [Taibaiella chishuiensis]PSK91228.1 putative secreted protein (Por secretion system target) [Taibaiella chishuiensis]